MFIGKKQKKKEGRSISFQWMSLDKKKLIKNTENEKERKKKAQRRESVEKERKGPKKKKRRRKNKSILVRMDLCLIQTEGGEF